jgi:nitrate/nitrite-specific signal transduction histidine kinase
VRDDGRGFDSSGALSMTDGHFGLLGMRERAERVGGQFDVASHAGAGTQITVSIPLDSEPVRKTSRPGLSGVFRIRQRPAQS